MLHNIYHQFTFVNARVVFRGCEMSGGADAGFGYVRVHAVLTLSGTTLGARVVFRGTYLSDGAALVGFGYVGMAYDLTHSWPNVGARIEEFFQRADRWR